MADGSVANLDNVQLLPVAWLLQRAGSIDGARWPEVCDAMAHARLWLSPCPPCDCET